MTILFFDGFDGYDSLDAYPADNSLQNAGYVYSKDSDTSSFISVSIGGSSKGNSVASYGYYYSGTSYYIYIDKSIGSVPQMCASIVFRSGSDNIGISRIVGIGDKALGYNVYYSVGAIIWSDAAGYLQLTGYPSGQVASIGVRIAAGVDYALELEILSDGTANAYLADGLAATVDIGSTGNVSYAGIGGYQLNSVRTNRYFDHFVVSDTRIGPTLVIPIAPSANGTLGNDFSVTPVENQAWQSVDDITHTNGTDLDDTYIEGNVSGAIQTFALASTQAFSGEAEAYKFMGSSKCANPSPYNVEEYLYHGGNELALGYYLPDIGRYYQRESAIQTTLPGGLPLTQANFEACELGVRLQKF